MEVQVAHGISVSGHIVKEGEVHLSHRYVLGETPPETLHSIVTVPADRADTVVAQITKVGIISELVKLLIDVARFMFKIKVWPTF